MKMDERGNVISISGFDAVYKKVNKTSLVLSKMPKKENNLWTVSSKGLMRKCLRNNLLKALTFCLKKKGVKIRRNLDRNR